MFKKFDADQNGLDVDEFVAMAQSAAAGEEELWSICPLKIYVGYW